MPLIKIIGNEYDGWGGYLGNLWGETSAQGRCYQAFISPPPFTAPLTEVLLPLCCIRKVGD